MAAITMTTSTTTATMSTMATTTTTTTGMVRKHNGVSPDASLHVRRVSFQDELDFPWDLRQIDVATAFMQVPLDAEVQSFLDAKVFTRLHFDETLRPSQDVPLISG